jgi:ABC-2 type transport system permease protein
MPASSRTGSTVTGFGRLVRFVLRRDRIRLPLWLLTLGGVIVISAGSLPPLYTDQASIDAYVALIADNPALKAFGGPGYGFDDPNLGVILVNEVQLWGAISFAVMSVFLVARHTRAEEDDERAEVIRSSVVGRHAPLAAAVAVVSAANVVLGAICAAGFVALGYEVVGSIALALSMVAVGLAFVGVTAVTAQVAGSARATIGQATAVLAALFVIRALGDSASSPVRWLSPIAWAQSVRAFAGEQWWPILLVLVLAVILLVVARALFDRRDLGSGMLAAHAGPASAARWLTRPLGLAMRLQRGPIIGWSVGLVITGAVYGMIGDEIAQYVEDNPAIAEVFVRQGLDLTDSFFATGMLLLAMIATGFSLSAALRPRTEENAGRADLMLATPLGRSAWLASHVAVSLVGTVVLMVAGGLGTGVAYALTTGDPGQILRLLGAALVTVPAAWVLAGVAVALFGLVPRAALLAWLALALVSIASYLGEILRLPHLVRMLSPYDHVPLVPAEPVRWLPLVLLSVVAGGLLAAGAWGFCRRDVHAS